MTNAATPRRRWFQFSLKALMLLVVVAAVPCVLLKAKMDRKAKERAAVAEINKLGGEVIYYWQGAHKKEPPGSAWLRKLLGDNFFATVTLVRLVGHNVTDDSLVNLEYLADPCVVYVGSGQLTDAGVAHLKGLRRLQHLTIKGTGLTDTGLSYLRGLTRLEKLVLKNTTVTNAGIAELQKALPNCQVIR